MADSGTNVITVYRPQNGPSEPIDVERIEVGTSGDYKPCVAKMPNGDMLISAYRTMPAGIDPMPNDSEPSGKRILEKTLLFRSQDGGQTWSPPRLPDIPGKEPYITVLDDGTLTLTTHLVSTNIENRKGYTYGLIHRSEDSGLTWTTILTSPAEAIHLERDNYHDCTTRNVLQLNDGSLFFVTSGVGADSHIVWRSFDRGRTWPEKYPAQIKGLPEDYAWSVMGETYLWQVKSGKIIALVRVDCRAWPEIDGSPLRISEDRLHDQYDRIIIFESTDLGQTWSRVRELGTYGQMYPSILRLQNGNLLLTFTQRTRTLDTPLGLRAVVGVEHEDGIEFDLEHDVFMIDTKTPEDLNSGGGFGPTIQLDDGTLVSSYSYATHVDEFTQEVYGGLRLEIARWRLPN